MPYSLVGSTLTKSGTDSGTSGAAGLSGVFYFSSGAKNICILDDSVISLFSITEDLVINADEETLIILGNIDVEQQAGSSFLMHGGSLSDYAVSTGLILNNNSSGVAQNTGSAAWQVKNTASFVARGGAIESGASIFFGSDTGTPQDNIITVDVDGTRLYGIGDIDSQHILRLFCASENVNVNVTLDGKLGSSASIFSTLGFNTLSATLINGGFNTDGNGQKPDVIVDNLDISKNTASRDITFITKSSILSNLNKYIFQNPSSAYQLKGYSLQGNLGIAEAKKQFKVAIKDLNGSAIPAAKVYAAFNSASENPVGRFAGIDDYLAAQIINETTGLNGETAELNPLVSVIQGYSTGPGQLLTTESLTSDEGDLQQFVSIAYGKLIKVSTFNLSGFGTTTYNEVLFDDTSIELDRDAAAALLTLNTAKQINDRAALYLVDNFAGEKEFIVRLSGNQIDALGKTLFIDSTASSVFSVLTGSVVTAKTSNYVGGATATTAKVIVAGATALNGGTFDCNVDYQSTATTLTNVTANQAIDFNTATTYTNDGGALSEVTNSSGGAVVINNINRGTVTTNTGPNITITNIAVFTITGIEAGSDVVILQAGTDTVLDSSDAQTGTTFIFNYDGAQNIDIGLIKPGLVTQYIYNVELTGVNSSLPVKQAVDRNYN